MAVQGRISGSKFETLPQEVIQHVISFVDDHDLKNVEQTSSQLYNLVNEPVLWRTRCSRFQYWEEKHFPPFYNEKNALDVIDWKKLFNYRLSVESMTTKLLNLIIGSPCERSQRMEIIASFGRDAKDTLLQHLRVGEHVEDVLARRYYASACIGCIHRKWAISEWKRLRSLRSEGSLEIALGCFDMFVLENEIADIERTLAILDHYSQSLAKATRNFETLTIRRKAIEILKFMRKESLSEPANAARFELKGCHLGFSLRHPGGVSPVISASIFCSLASRLGLRAHICLHPFTVYSFVVIEDGSHMYVDPQGEPKEIAVDVLKDQLLRAGISGEKATWRYLRPTPIVEVVLRCAKDIQLSIQQGGGSVISTPTNVNRAAADFASVCVSTLLSDRLSTRNLESLCRCLQEDFPADVGFVEREIVPLSGDNAGRLLTKICMALRNADAAPRRSMRRRDPENQHVRHCIGTVFRHKKYSYCAVITGWTTSCLDVELREESVQAETLNRGVGQPFYHVLVEDMSMRYVAEENIMEIKPTNVGTLQYLAGKYFKRFDILRGRFISNLKFEYPDD